MRQIANILFCALLTGLGAPARAVEGAVHPSIYVDKGACPGEGCTYGRWKVLKDTPLRALPDVTSKVVTTCRAGSAVSASTGEVHTVAGKFTVKKKHGPFVPGDVQDLNFSPWGGSGGSRCEMEGRCWGELDKELDSVWWIRIENADGVTGWTREGGNFDTGEK